MLLNVMLGIITLLTSYIVVSSSSIPEGYYCTDYEAEKKTNMRFSFEDVGVPGDCPGCRRGYIDVAVYNHITNMPTYHYVYIWYTLNHTVNGPKVIIQPGRFTEYVESLLRKLHLSLTIWDAGIPYTPIGPDNEDYLTLPIDRSTNATLTYGNCARGLTRKPGSHYYCSTSTSSLLQDIRLQFLESDWPPFLGRLTFLQEEKDSSLLKTVGWTGWQFHGTARPSTLSLVKTVGTDLSEFLGIESLGNDSAMRTNDFWLNADPMSYDFWFDKITVKASEHIDFSPC